MIFNPLFWIFKTHFICSCVCLSIEEVAKKATFKSLFFIEETSLTSLNECHFTCLANVERCQTALNSRLTLPTSMRCIISIEKSLTEYLNKTINDATLRLNATRLSLHFIIITWPKETSCLEMPEFLGHVILPNALSEQINVSYARGLHTRP